MRFLTLLFVLLYSTEAAVVASHSLPQPLSMLTEAPSISGDRLSQGKLANKPIVITFFASWCPPCRHEFEQLNALKTHPQANNATIIAINVFEDNYDKNPARLKRFLETTKPTFPVIKGNAQTRKAFGNITRIPTLIVYDKTGKENWRFIHKEGATKMSAELDEIVDALREVVDKK